MTQQPRDSAGPAHLFLGGPKEEHQAKEIILATGVRRSLQETVRCQRLKAEHFTAGGAGFVDDESRIMQSITRRSSVRRGAFSNG